MGEREVDLTCCQRCSILAGVRASLCEETMGVDGVCGGEMEVLSKGPGRQLSSIEEPVARSRLLNERGERGEVPIF